MCEKNCRTELMLYGAILNKCWGCFQKNIRENPECIHHSIRIPQTKPRTNEIASILDKDGTILYEPKQKYVCKTMTDILMEELEHDSTSFTYKALTHMIQNNATRTYPNALFHLYWSIFVADNEEELDADDYSRKYLDRRLKLMSTALEYGWYEPALVTMGSKKQIENLWLVHLIDIMWEYDIPVYFDFKKLVWQFLERGEELLEDRITKYSANYIPYFKIEEKKKEMGIEEGTRLSHEEKKDIEKAIWLGYTEKMKKYVSEYYSQECMKQPE